MIFTASYDERGISLVPDESSRVTILGFLRRRRGPVLGERVMQERDVAFALADLKAAAETTAEDLRVEDTSIFMSHRLAAGLDSRTASILGLPPLVHLSFRTDAEGVIGSTSFRLRYEWLKDGRRQVTRRIGSILMTGDGSRRLPAWMLEAIEIADSFEPGRDDSGHWEALAKFRNALDPGIRPVEDDLAARVSLTDFLQGLEVRLADRFSISPIAGLTGLDFEVVPFSGKSIGALIEKGEAIGETDGELQKEDLATFQRRVRQRGALPAYKVGHTKYLVVDRSAMPALKVMARMQRAEPDERAAFVKNPWPAIAKEVEETLRINGKLDNLSDSGREEAIEIAATSILLETREYSGRVVGVGNYEKPSLVGLERDQTTWLPEVFETSAASFVASLKSDDLPLLSRTIEEAIAAGQEKVTFAGHELPANPISLEAIRELERIHARTNADAIDTEAEKSGYHKPVIVKTEDNFSVLRWKPGRSGRAPGMESSAAVGVRTPLLGHQVDSFSWQTRAWAEGLPGVLNADEPGLGKTLQTIAFLRWLKARMESGAAPSRGPMLVVAPTSLLENWEIEVSRHLEAPGLGHLIRLYGAGVGAYKKAGAKGVDTTKGDDLLDFSLMHEAVAEGRADRFWILTTYTTLTNYQHSLAKVPFSVAVFDEIQALKNPASLRAFAARALNADFRIGLTGTPIENTTVDLWAIMDQLCPGALGTLKDFAGSYGVPNESNMQELHDMVFLPDGSRPPLAMRRLKEQVARSLPAKVRRIHPRNMSSDQSTAYEAAREKLSKGGKGSALRMLHHIRSVSVHPAVESHRPDDEYIEMSGRLSATFQILREIKSKQERALVFIEHRRMQYRFVELARLKFGLNEIEIINGDTPIQKRQAIVDRFQRHLAEDRGFDILVLGPKAAGVGLTLTAATHVLHLSRWWNPAVEEQCNDRIHRIGQTKDVTIHIPMAIHPDYREHSFDCLLHSLMMRKRRTASAALWPMGDTADDASELQLKLTEGLGAGDGDPVRSAVVEMFRRDALPVPAFQSDGSLVID